MLYIPVNDKVLVKRDKPVAQVGKVILPDSAKEKPKTGVVLAIGKGRLSEESGERLPMSVCKGDKVLFTKFSGFEVEEDLILLSESDILAVVK
jgi:chaperonin GroES